jgi:hypothetical protein
LADANPLILGPELPHIGAAAIPLYITNPERGKRDILTHRFFRSVWQPGWGLVPERVQRHAEQFFDRIREARAFLDLRQAAESLAFMMRTDPSYGRAARVRQMADRYLETFQMVGAPT